MPRALLGTGRLKGPKAIQSFPYPVLRSSSTASCHVTILQLLTCYAYILQILDPFVARLAMQLEAPPSSEHAQPQSWPAAAGLSPPGRSNVSRTSISGTSSGSSSQACTNNSPIFPEIPTRLCNSVSMGAEVTGQAFSIGGFSFASQPALNADLLLRAVMQMMSEIHAKTSLLALGEAGMDWDREPSSIYSPGLDEDTFFLGPAASSPVILSARAVMAVVQAKERALSQRMRDLTQE